MGNKEMEKLNTEELGMAEMEKVSGGSLHFPHPMDGKVWHCSWCHHELIIPHGQDTTWEVENHKINCSKKPQSP